MMLRFGICVAALGLVMLSGTPAEATDPLGTPPVVTGDKDTVVVDDVRGGSETPANQGSQQVAITIPEPYKEYRYIPACSGNDIEVSDEDETVTIGDNLCNQATRTCNVPGDIQYRVFTLQHEADGSVRDGADYVPAGMQCRGPDDVPEGGPVQITVADIAEQAREAAPETVVKVEPVDRSYVNLPTNFYADSGAADATVTVLGQDIGLRFEPSGFAWAYGDGASGTGAGVAGSKVGAADAVEHAYRRSGDVSVTLTRTFDVAFTLPGGQTGTLPAPGVSNTSDPYPLQIREIQATVTDIG